MVGMNGGGRRAHEITEADKQALFALLRVSVPLKIACRALGIHREAVNYWLRMGKVPFSEHESFRQDVEKAQATAVCSLVQTVGSHAGEHWQAAAWLLERQFPESFSMARWARDKAERTQHTDAPILLGEETYRKAFKKLEMENKELRALVRTQQQAVGDGDADDGTSDLAGD